MHVGPSIEMCSLLLHTNRNSSTTAETDTFASTTGTDTTNPATSQHTNNPEEHHGKPSIASAEVATDYVIDAALSLSDIYVNDGVWDVDGQSEANLSDDDPAIQLERFCGNDVIDIESSSKGGCDSEHDDTGGGDRHEHRVAEFVVIAKNARALKDEHKLKEFRTGGSPLGRHFC
ncbi:unnamed protein product [Polarella glacialis]|uniref:Uncharacterized protein n=1 Tax=Polarella glacialis TaxID=89957 RepID=A0A813JAT6_POLGL|nr:unnamed protein product [Polarella glacialis]